MQSLHPRIDLDVTAPGAERALGTLDDYVSRLGLDPLLVELVRMRVSQVNGCHVRLDMHSRAARARGETEQRLYVLDAWREAPYYTERERAALAWAEAVTLVADGHVPDEVYDEVRQHFDEAEVAALTLATVAINSWTRVAISLRMLPVREPAVAA